MSCRHAFVGLVCTQNVCSAATVVGYADVCTHIVGSVGSCVLVVADVLLGFGCFTVYLYVSSVTEVLRASVVAFLCSLQGKPTTRGCQDLCYMYRV